MSELRWEDPPPEQRQQWGSVADRLRARPGVWAVVFVAPNINAARTVVSSIQAGRRSGMPAGEFEARSATVDGEHRVYARYVGGAS